MALYSAWSSQTKVFQLECRPEHILCIVHHTKVSHSGQTDIGDMTSTSSAGDVSG